MTSEPWINYNKNGKYQYFNETEEKNWKGPFYFIQASDIQFGLITKGQKTDNWEKEKVLAQEFVEKVNLMNPKPRFFVMCGDLCDAMPDSELEKRKKQEIDYKKIFYKINKEIPLINVCGNHDVGNIPSLKTIEMYQTSFGDDYYSFWCGGILFLVINSQYFVDSSKVTNLAEQHSKWLNEKLEEAHKEKKRIIIFQHVPWFLNSMDDEESYFTINKELRKKWLDKFIDAGVEAVFCGHYHRNAGGVYNKLSVIVTTALGCQLGRDKSGARIVNVLNNKIEHSFYEIENLPVNNKL